MNSMPKPRTKATTISANKYTKFDRYEPEDESNVTRSSGSLSNNELQTSIAAWNQCGTLLATHTEAMLSSFSTF